MSPIWSKFREIRNGTATSDVCLRLLATAGHFEERTRQRLGDKTWWQAWGEWVDHREAVSNRRRIAELLSDRWDALAAEVILHDVRHFHENRGDLRNPFAPRVLEYVDEVVAALASGELVRPWPAVDAAETIEELANRLTPEAVREFVRTEVSRRLEVAADPLMLTLDDGNDLTVQHQASGLRAEFRHRGKAIGVVFAKSYKIPSIDPRDRRDPLHDDGSWEQYVGLGIGQRIYQHAAVLLPKVRWRAGTQSDAAIALRRRLHSADPWRWQSRLCTCRDHWDGLTRTGASAAEHHPTLSLSHGP